MWVCCDSMHGLKHRLSEMFNYFHQAAQLMCVKVRFVFIPNLCSYQLKSICAVTCGEKPHTGPLHRTV